jgi:hypothetical protein
MGSLNDVYFHPANGNAENQDEAQQLNRRFGSLINEAYELATELTRPMP